MGLVNLPSELLLQIFLLLPFPSIRALTKTCHRLHSPANVALYTHLSFSSSSRSDKSLSTPLPSHSLLKTLLVFPSLQTYIRSLHINHSSAWPLLSHLLGTAPSLEFLVLKVNQNFNSEFMEPIFRPSSLPPLKLVHFSHFDLPHPRSLEFTISERMSLHSSIVALRTSTLVVRTPGGWHGGLTAATRSAAFDIPAPTCDIPRLTSSPNLTILRLNLELDSGNFRTDDLVRILPPTLTILEIRTNWIAGYMHTRGYRGTFDLRGLTALRELTLSAELLACGMKSLFGREGTWRALDEVLPAGLRELTLAAGEWDEGGGMWLRGGSHIMGQKEGLWGALVSWLDSVAAGGTTAALQRVVFEWLYIEREWSVPPGTVTLQQGIAELHAKYPAVTFLSKREAQGVWRDDEEWQQVLAVTETNIDETLDYLLQNWSGF
ncbi:hypothetical protein EDC01DRAFT_633745 [Geopyxis carbonaria]|nr:hypothetical protein EDC01DRAFT_633745 [Geopyxis carbonaria]